MRCILCESEDSSTVIIESFACKHCGEEVRIEYNFCKSCGFAWKTVDGKVLADVTFVDECLAKLFDEDDVFDESSPVLNIIPVSEDDNCMNNYIHKCLRCQALCFESEEGHYECTECGFVWEVMKPR